MAHVEACGPVTVENKSIAKILELPLVEFAKHSHIIVQMNSENVTLNYDSPTRMYIVKYNGHDYSCDGPSYRPVHD